MDILTVTGSGKSLFEIPLGGPCLGFLRLDERLAFPLHFKYIIFLQFLFSIPMLFNVFVFDIINALKKTNLYFL